jgi:hypothetical protein
MGWGSWVGWGWGGLWLSADRVARGGGVALFMESGKSRKTGLYVYKRLFYVLYCPELVGQREESGGLGCEQEYAGDRRCGRWGGKGVLPGAQ